MSIAFEGHPTPEPTPNLPSGYNRVEQYPFSASVDRETLPWLKEANELPVVQCTLDSGESFLLANAIGTSDRLIQAAEGMNGQQAKNANNMFYSRLPQYVRDGHSGTIDTLASPSTPFPIKVMRNSGGQRVYFGVAELPLANGESRQVLLRLGACDKNKQSQVLKTLSTSDRKTTK